MNNLAQSRFASVATILVGGWVALSPIWISVTGGALTTMIVTGVVIALAGLVQLFWKSSAPTWVSSVAAVWLFISAFAYSGLSSAAKWSAALSAIAAVALALWDGLEISDFNQSHNRGGQFHAQ